MANKTTIEKKLEQWWRSENPQPLLLTGQEAEDSATAFTAKLDATTEVIRLSDDEASLKVKEIRLLLEQLHHTSLKKKRLIVIPGAERLLPASANALLKELEESGKQNRFLLVTAYPGRLLPTIRSRCQIVRVATQTVTPVAKGEMPRFDSKRKTPLTSEEIEAVAALLQLKLQAGGSTAPLRRSFLRLRDYYKIKAVGGNSRLAADVLLASIIELQDT